MSSFIEAIENITPEIYENLKQAVELGKWGDGRKLTQEQKETCLAAMIAWEMKNLPEEERMVLLEPLQVYIEAQVNDHIENPRDDITNYLLNVEVEGNKLQMEHIFGTIVLILIAGIDTTWSAIGSSLWHLAQNEDDMSRLRNEPELMDTAIEEFLRFYAPVTMARKVVKDVEVSGCPMHAGDQTLVTFPAANHDPKEFDRADEFILDRENNRHVAFGAGIHRCAGSNLARMELRVAIEEWLAQIPEFHLTDGGEVTWAGGQVRGPRVLPVLTGR